MTKKIILPDRYTFSQVVRELSVKGKHEVIPLSDNTVPPADSLIINILKSTMNNLIHNNKLTISAKHSRKIRINDINIPVIDTIFHYLISNHNKDNTMIYSKLDTNSYGDIQIQYTFAKDSYFVEFICTTKHDLKGDHLRAIYLSHTLKNIGTDTGKHILILIIFDVIEEGAIFKAQYYKMKDLSHVPLSLKIEYSASLDDIDKLEDL